MPRAEQELRWSEVVDGLPLWKREVLEALSHHFINALNAATDEADPPSLSAAIMIVEDRVRFVRENKKISWPLIASIMSHCCEDADRPSLKAATLRGIYGRMRRRPPKLVQVAPVLSSEPPRPTQRAPPNPERNMLPSSAPPKTQLDEILRNAAYLKEKD